MGPDTLRQVKDKLATLNTIKEKAKKLLGNVEKLGKLPPMSGCPSSNVSLCPR